MSSVAFSHLKVQWLTRAMLYPAELLNRLLKKSAGLTLFLVMSTAVKEQRFQAALVYDQTYVIYTYCICPPHSPIKVDVAVNGQCVPNNEI